MGKLCDGKKKLRARETLAKREEMAKNRTQL
jgi:hypothetical protein